MARPSVKLQTPPGRPIWPTVREERPWGLPAAFWNFATPWAIVRIYGHIGERCIYQVWWWSRAPIWWLQDNAYTVDWWLQGLVKRVHERRVSRARRRRRA